MTTRFTDATGRTERAEHWQLDGITLDRDAQGRPILTGSGAGGSHTLGSHADVTVSGLETGDQLFYDAASGALEWINLRNSIPVKAHGAVGDGSTDDSTAIQAAIDAWAAELSSTTRDNTATERGFGPVLLFADGHFRVNTTLDFTGIRVPGACVVFQNASIMGRTTATPVIDATNSRHIDWYGVDIQAPYSADAPDIGILLARNSGNAAAGNMSFYRTRIRGHFSKACVYCYASEENVFYRPELINFYTTGTPYCFVAARTNLLSAASVYETIATTDQSMNGFYLRDIDCRQVNAGELGLLDGVQTFHFSGYGAFGSAMTSTYDTMIRVTSEGSVSAKHLEVVGHFECPGAAAVSSIVMYEITTSSAYAFQGCKIIDHAPQTDALLGFSNFSTNINGVELTAPFTASVAPFYADSGSAPAVQNSRIYNETGAAVSGAIDLSVLNYFNGLIQTRGPDDVTPTSGLNNTRAFVIGRDRMWELPGRSTLTISSGVLDISTYGTFVFVNGEGSAADVLDVVSGNLTDGLEITLFNPNSYVITLTHDSTTDGFFFRDGQDLTLGPNTAIRCQYMASISRWVDLSHGTGSPLNVMWFGATGDGSTDDTTAVLAAISALGSDGGILYFPPGTYVLTSQLALDFPNIILSGAGAQKSSALTGQQFVTKLQFTLGSAVPAVEITDRHIRLERMHLEASGGSGTSCIYAYLPSPTTTLGRMTLDDISIEGFAEHGIHTYGCENVEINNCYVMDCSGYGIWLQKHPTYQGITQNIRRTRVIRCGSTASGAAGDANVYVNVNQAMLVQVQALDTGGYYNIHVDGAQDAVLDQCDIERADYSGVAHGLRIYRSDNVHVRNCFGWDLDSFIQLDGDAGNHARNVRIEGCRCGSCVTGIEVQKNVENLTLAYLQFSSVTTEYDLVGSTGVSGIRVIGNPVSTPSALSAGDNDDYDTDYEYEILRLTADSAGSTLTGMQPVWDGRELLLLNISAYDITIPNEDTGSTAAYRFLTPDASSSVTLGENVAARCKYDGTTARWRVLWRSVIDYSELANVPSSFVAAVHDITGAQHSVSGVTPGYFLKTGSGGTFDWEPHGLTYTDVGAAASSHSHTKSAITDTPWDTDEGGTGRASYTAGDMVYYASGTTLNAIGVAGASVGDVLTLQSGDIPAWEAPAPAAHGLESHTDVDPSMSEAQWDVLYWSGSQWTNRANVAWTDVNETVSGNWLWTGSVEIDDNYLEINAGTREYQLSVSSNNFSIRRLDSAVDAGIKWAIDGDGALQTGSVPVARLSGSILTSNGGTGLSSYSAGDIVYYASGTAFTKLTLGTETYVLKAGASAPGWGQVGYSELSGVPSSFVPAQHDIDNATYHSVSGITPGYFLKTGSGDTFGWEAHGLTYTDVGAAASSHSHTSVDLPATVAYTDAANVFTADQEIQKSTPRLILDATGSTGGAVRFEQSGTARARIRYGLADNWLAISTVNASNTLTNRVRISGETDNYIFRWGASPTTEIDYPFRIYGAGLAVQTDDDEWLGLEVVHNDDASGNWCGLGVTTHESSSNESVPMMWLIHAHGTATTPAVTEAGDILGRFDFGGWVPTQGYAAAGARIEAHAPSATGDWATGDTPGELSFYTAENGTAALVERMTISHDGNVDIVSGTLSWGTGAALSSSDDVVLTTAANVFTNVQEIDVSTGSAGLIFDVDLTTPDIPPASYDSPTIQFKTYWDDDTTGAPFASDHNYIFSRSLDTGNASSGIVIQHGSGSSYTFEPVDQSAVIVDTDDNIASLSLICASTTGISSIWFGDPDAQQRGRVRYEHTDDQMLFYTANAARVTISSSGELIVGTDPGASELFQVNGTSRVYDTFTLEGDTGSTALTWHSTNGSSFSPIGEFNAVWDSTVVARVRFRSGGDTTNKDDGDIVFQTATSGSAAANAMRLTQNQDAIFWGAVYPNDDSTDLCGQTGHVWTGVWTDRLTSDNNIKFGADAGGPQMYHPTHDNGAVSGSSFDLNWTNGNVQYANVTYTGSITVSQSNEAAGSVVTLILRNGSGSTLGAFTWSEVDWGDFGDPTLPANGDCAILTFYCHASGTIFGVNGGIGFTGADI